MSLTPPSAPREATFHPKTSKNSTPSEAVLSTNHGRTRSTLPNSVPNVGVIADDDPRDLLPPPTRAISTARFEKQSDDGSSSWATTFAPRPFGANYAALEKRLAKYMAAAKAGSDAAMTKAVAENLAEAVAENLAAAKAESDAIRPEVEETADAVHGWETTLTLAKVKEMANAIRAEIAAEIAAENDAVQAESAAEGNAVRAEVAAMSLSSQLDSKRATTKLGGVDAAAAPPSSPPAATRRGNAIRVGGGDSNTTPPSLPAGTPRGSKRIFSPPLPKSTTEGKASRSLARHATPPITPSADISGGGTVPSLREAATGDGGAIRRVRNFAAVMATSLDTEFAAFHEEAKSHGSDVEGAVEPRLRVGQQDNKKRGGVDPAPTAAQPAAPTAVPTAAPPAAPSAVPTAAPPAAPSAAPTATPPAAPLAVPTAASAAVPTTVPAAAPRRTPTAVPAAAPAAAPAVPTKDPAAVPTAATAAVPTATTADLPPPPQNTRSGGVVTTSGGVAASTGEPYLGLEGAQELPKQRGVKDSGVISSGPRAPPRSWKSRRPTGRRGRPPDPAPLELELDCRATASTAKALMAAPAAPAAPRHAPMSGALKPAGPAPTANVWVALLAPRFRRRRRGRRGGRRERERQERRQDKRRPREIPLHGGVVLPPPPPADSDFPALCPSSPTSSGPPSTASRTYAEVTAGNIGSDFPALCAPDTDSAGKVTPPPTPDLTRAGNDGAFRRSHNSGGEVCWDTIANDDEMGARELPEHRGVKDSVVVSSGPRASQRSRESRRPAGRRGKPPYPASTNQAQSKRRTKAANRIFCWWRKLTIYYWLADRTRRRLYRERVAERTRRRLAREYRVEQENSGPDRNEQRHVAPEWRAKADDYPVVRSDGVALRGPLQPRVSCVHARDPSWPYKMVGSAYTGACGEGSGRGGDCDSSLDDDESSTGNELEINAGEGWADGFSLSCSSECNDYESWGEPGDDGSVEISVGYSDSSDYSDGSW